MYRTAEFVSPKHPDKICDRISDRILDYCLSEDKNARVAVETMGGHGHIYVNGEITLDSKKEIPVPHLVEEVLETSDLLRSTQVNIVNNHQRLVEVLTKVEQETKVLWLVTPVMRMMNMYLKNID